MKKDSKPILAKKNNALASTANAKNASAHSRSLVITNKPLNQNFVSMSDDIDNEDDRVIEGEIVLDDEDALSQQEFYREEILPRVAKTFGVSSETALAPLEPHSFVHNPDIIIPDLEDDNMLVELDDSYDTMSFDLEETIQEPGLIKHDALQTYLRELNRYPLLAPEEERLTAIDFVENHNSLARNKLITSNLRLVVKIAMEYKYSFPHILDLIQEGNAGLVQAVNRFNPYRGVKLSTYSAWWIRAYILKFLMDNKSLVRMGTTDAQRKLFFRLRGEAERLYAATQKFDAKLLAERIGVQTQDVIDMHQRLSKNDISLDTPLGEDGDARQVDLLQSHFDSADENLEKEQLLSILRKQFKKIEKELNDRDLFILKERILADEPITLQDVGNKFGITRERARQLEARVIQKIKEKVLEAGIMR